MAEDSDSYVERGHSGKGGGGGNSHLHLPVESLNVKVDGFQFASVTPDYDYDDRHSAECPFSHDEYASPDSWQVWWLVVPEEFFTVGAKTYSDMLYQQLYDIAEKYQRMLQLMLRVAKLINDNRRRPVCVTACDHVLAKGSIVSDPSTHKFSGVRYRLMAPRGGDETDFGKIVQRIINTNEKDEEKRSSVVSNPRRKGGNGDCRPAYTSLTMADWMDMANVITGRRFPQMVAVSVSDEDSCYHPSRLYGIAYNVTMTRGLKTKIHPEWEPWIGGFVKMKDLDAQQPNGGIRNVMAYVYPADGVLAWKISLERFTSNRFRGTFFPWVKPSSSAGNGVVASSAACQAFIQQACLSHELRVEDDPDDLGELLREDIRAPIDRMTPEEAKRHYDNHVNHHDIDDSPPTMEKVAAICRAAIQATKDRCKAAGHTEDADYTREAIVRTKMEGIDLYEKTMVHEDAVLSPAGKAIVKWRKEYLSTHRNLCKPRDNKYANLSSFGNLIAILMSGLEGAGAVNVMHQEAILLFLSACYVPSADVEQINVLFSGPAATSKSHLLVLLMKILIEGTMRKSSYTTMAAYTASAEDSKNPAAHLIHDEQILANDELRGTEAGISTGPGSRSSGSDSTSDASSILKGMLTSGEMSFQSVKFNENRDRVADAKKIPVRSGHWYCFNFALSFLDPALRTRFLCIQVESVDRKDTPGLLALASSTVAGKRKDAWDGIIQRLQLHQAHSTAVWRYIQFGFLPPIDMDTMMRAVVLPVLLEGGKSGMDNCYDIRRRKMLERLIKQQVILDAADKVFDAPMSRLKYHDFSPYHYLELAPHLVAQTRHVVFAFGLMKDSYEDKIGHKIREKVYEYVERNQDVVVAKPVVSGNPVLASYLPSVPGVRGSRVEVAAAVPVEPYIRCSAMKLFGMNASHSLTTTEMINRFAKEILDTMAEKPLDATVQSVIKLMTETKQLDLSMEYLRIPRVRDNAPVTLKSILERHLNHRYAQRQDLQYSKSHIPFLFDVISVAPGDTSRRCMIQHRAAFVQQIDADIEALIEQAEQTAIDAVLPDSLFRMNLEDDDPPPDNAIIDKDVDLFAVDHHNAECGGFSLVQLAEPPTNDVFLETERNWAFMSHYHPYKLPYPICFPQWYVEEYVRRQKSQRRKLETATHHAPHQTASYWLRVETDRKRRDRAQEVNGITKEELHAAQEARRVRQRELNPLNLAEQVRSDYIRPVPLPATILATNPVYHHDPPVRRFLSEFDDLTIPRYEDERYEGEVEQSEREYLQECNPGVAAETDDEEEEGERMQE